MVSGLDFILSVIKGKLRRNLHKGGGKLICASQVESGCRVGRQMCKQGREEVGPEWGEADIGM